MGNHFEFYFEVLHVPKHSSPQEIRTAYRALVKKWHPDKHPPSSRPEAEAKFKAISEAYKVIIDQQDNRAMVGAESPRHRSQELQRPRRTSPIRTKPPSVERKLGCTLEELCRGCKKDVKFTRDIVTSNGLIVGKEETQTIWIKPGWKKGTKITFEGKGDERPGCFPADIVFVISEKEHPIFKRVGNDLVLKAEVPLVNALTGWSFSFRLPTGEKMNCSFQDEIIYPEYEKVIEGQGMPSAHEKGVRGNLRIKFHIVFPKQLSVEQRSSIMELLKGGT
ncbi:hypothetical protein OPV22_012441 [Ensete ventricosum]|uniref:J domain-containing protein n=1 Tax=Ensete ventricosum TaxID=4639 RepID=A0AAV8R666_ENSVE|nr:hypothetical protein OPV22_012441 [Ensete ventricosum]